MEGSAPRDVGRPSKMAPYAPEVTRWLREDPTLSSSEILRRVRLAGYRGGKSALYEFVRRRRAPGSGYQRCPRCRALLRDIVEFCRHCGLGWSSPLSPSRALSAETAGPRPEGREATGEHPAPGPAVERYLVIAAPDRPDLYDYLRQKFAPSTAIEVVRERRVAERRQSAAALSLDRRRGDRRARPALDAELRILGFAIVRRD